MYLVAISHLHFLKHHGASRFIASCGLLGWLPGERTEKLPSLDFPPPGIELPPPLPDFVEAVKTQVTTLPNGVKIASETSTNPVASVGLYIDSGSIYEKSAELMRMLSLLLEDLAFGGTMNRRHPRLFSKVEADWRSKYEKMATLGVSPLLEKMAFKSTMNRSHSRLVREVEAIGGNVSASASREHMSYTYDALKTYLPEMVEVLIDTVRNPAFLDCEVKEQLQQIKAERAELLNNPQGLLLEGLHSVGFSKALAQPLLAPTSSLHTLDGSILRDFVAENYTASRMVLAASGVEHGDLVSIAEPLLSDLPLVEHPPRTAGLPSWKISPQVLSCGGGDYRYQVDSAVTHVAIGFEVRRGWSKEKRAITATVLQMLLGGKGRRSRLYHRVLNKYERVESLSAFNILYKHTGMFGVYATTRSDFVPMTVDLMVAELAAVATPGKVTEEELHRSKEATKSALLMSLESRKLACEDIGRQILTFGERKPIEHFLKAIDEITLDDISSTMEKMLKDPSPTMASWGDGKHFVEKY